MRVLHVCSEVFPLLKTDGLADVIGTLSVVQIMEGTDTRVLLPAFPDIRRGVVDAQVVTHRDTFAGQITLLYDHFNGVGIYLIDAPYLYSRLGGPYHNTNQHTYIDNVLRFALLGWMGSEIVSGLDPFWRPNVVHAHDWHTGLTPTYLAARERPAKSVFAMHSLAYQEMFYSWHMNSIELPWSFYNMHDLEFSGRISFPKADLYYADHITAISPTYAHEIAELQHAYDMEGLLCQRHHEGRLSGILNGVDGGIWSPQNDLLLPVHYDHDTLEEGAENKRQLRIAMGLKVDNRAPLFAVINRLTSQRGLDLVLETLPGLLEQGGQLALLDAGDSVLQEGFPTAAIEHPGKVGVQIGYHKAFSHRITDGADVVLVPSRFEPCSLTQLYGLKYSTLPLVRRTRGLVDTVSDSSLENLADSLATGFVFEDSNVLSLLRTIRHAFVLWSRPSLWHYMQRQAMDMDFSWQVAADSYHELYQRLMQPLGSLL